MNYTVSLGSNKITIIDLKTKVVANDPEGTKKNIMDYLIGQGFPAGNIQISIEANDITRGELIDYPPAGPIDKSETITIKISSGSAD